MPRTPSSADVGRDAMVSYNILDARHSSDGVILLVTLRGYDVHPWRIFEENRDCSKSTKQVIFVIFIPIFFVHYLPSQYQQFFFFTLLPFEIS